MKIWVQLCLVGILAGCATSPKPDPWQNIEVPPPGAEKPLSLPQFPEPVSMNEDTVSFDLDGARPTVTVLAAYSKRRREDVLPLRPDTAAELRDLLGRKMPDLPAFNVPDKTAKMFRADLAAARAAWLEGTTSAQDRRSGEGSTFLSYCDASGRVADFHALRHTAGSLLAASGAHPKVAQTIMRHSDINLTLSLYSHTYAGQEADAVAALPDLGPPATKAAATGTDDESVNVRAARAKQNLGA